MTDFLEEMRIAEEKLKGIKAPRGEGNGHNMSKGRTRFDRAKDAKLKDGKREADRAD